MGFNISRFKFLFRYAYGETGWGTCQDSNCVLLEYGGHTGQTVCAKRVCTCKYCRTYIIFSRNSVQVSIPMRKHSAV
jgi:hypothetical protein